MAVLDMILSNNHQSEDPHNERYRADGARKEEDYTSVVVGLLNGQPE